MSRLPSLRKAGSKKLGRGRRGSQERGQTLVRRTHPGKVPEDTLARPASGKTLVRRTHPGKTPGDTLMPMPLPNSWGAQGCRLGLSLQWREGAAQNHAVDAVAFSRRRVLGSDSHKLASAAVEREANEDEVDEMGLGAPELRGA